MEKDGLSNLNNTLPSDLIGKLILNILTMLRNPVVDNNLGQTLDIFMDVLQDNQNYLSQGIFNVKFAEAAVFLQHSVELYSKKVDTLFQHMIDYQMSLTTTCEQGENAANEIAKLEERMTKRRKRKPIIQDVSVSGNANFLVRSIAKCEKVLESCTADEYCDELKDRWDALIHNQTDTAVPDVENDDDMDSSDLKSDCFFKKINLTCNYRINDFCNGEKLGFFDGFLSSRSLFVTNLYWDGVGVTDGIDRISNSESENEDVLCDAEVTSSCVNNSPVVNITKLPQNLMDAFSNSDLNLTRTLIHGLLVSSCAPGCEQSNFDSILHRQEIDGSDHGYNSGASQLCSETQSCCIRRSNDDSGIFCSQLSNNTIMEVDEIEHDNTKTANVIPEENLSDVQNEVTASTQTSAKPEFNFSALFMPMLSSTPKKLLPVVKLERLSRKRLLDIDDAKRPKPKRVRRCKWLKTVVALERNFEKFHNNNYVPALDEGVILPWVDDSSDDDLPNSHENAKLSQLNEEPDTAPDDSGIKQFCQELLFEVVDNIISGYDDEITDRLSAVDGNIDADGSADHLDVIEDAEESPVQQETISFAMEKVIAINDWRNFIQPIIATAESQSKFNIHEYGTKLMDAIPENKNLPFKDLVIGKPSDEVVRYFIASLQLANTYNIELVNTCPGKLANDELEMKLLSRDRYHEHLEEYEAPSEHTIKEKLARVSVLNHNRPSTLHGQSLSLHNQSSLSLLQPLLQQNRSRAKNRAKRSRF